jgi:hypothetical protein
MKLPKDSTLVVASHNQGKVREIIDLLTPFGIAVKHSPPKPMRWPMIPASALPPSTVAPVSIRRAGPVKSAISPSR